MRQKTIQHENPEVLDTEVNEFVKANNVKASQSYFALNKHVRVLFYE